MNDSHVTAKGFPAMKGKLANMALYAPIVDVSVVDLTYELQKSTTYGEICAENSALKAT